MLLNWPASVLPSGARGGSLLGEKPRHLDTHPELAQTRPDIQEQGRIDGCYILVIYSGHESSQGNPRPRRRRPPPGSGVLERPEPGGAAPKEFRFPADEVDIHRDGDRVILEPVTIPRDKNGWPLVVWDLMGSAPDFDVGDRSRPPERKDALGRKRARLS